MTSVQRRRHWSRAEKERIVAASMEPGAVDSEVTRASGIYASQLFRWRRQLSEPAQIPAVFNPVAIKLEPEAARRRRQIGQASSRASLRLAAVA
jgi:transposase